MSTTAERRVRPDPSEGRGPIVVGIGASAGGLPALKTFLDNMPAGHHLGLVLVQHLDPHAESMMARLLAEHSALRVMVARDGLPVEADHVYTLPPGKQIRIEDGVLRLSERPPGREGHFPIDAFLCSLAEDQEEDAIAVILTGSGADGSKGVREVKARGGAVFAQDPRDAEQPGMPESAIATGAVDVVADIAALPARIVAYSSHLARGSEGASPGERLSEVLHLVRERTGMDFSGYKEGTLGRRLQRRMGLRRTADLEEYLRVLREEPEELDHLRRDILIGVTSFFRDEEAFAALEDVVAGLFEGRDPTDDVRVWICGCSTGEEAYSVAMLLLERREAAGSNVAIRVFATDANAEAIHVARAGVYSDSSLAAVPMERVARFFSVDPAHPGRYTVTPRLREVVTFATQDLVVDPPLPKLDLICCRNVLIYLTADVQRALLERFHFSLKPSGHLFLGKTESVPQDAPFEPISRRWRIFRRAGTGSRAPRDRGLPPPRRQPLADPAAPSPARRSAPREQSVSDVAQAWLLKRYAPAAVVIDESHRILSFHGPIDTFLNLPRGESVLDLLAMPKEGLRSLVRTAVYRAAREVGPIRLSGALRDGSHAAVDVHVEPLRAGARKPLYIVTFQEKAVAAPPEERPEGGAAADDEYVRQIEDELKATRADLDETVESSQNHYEELQAANEEVTSMNEELRAANEELMASKEELQALNEEVTNAHDELQAKFEALRKTTDDLDNILASTGIATLFVDREFRIVRSTPALARLMNVRAGDAGRPLGDITWRFDDPDFLEDAKEVLRTLAPRQKEVRTREGHRFQRRLAPYRTREDRIEGVLVTFEDIEEKRLAQEAVDAARAYAEGIVATIREPLVILDQEARVVSANPAFYRRFRLEARKTGGSSLFDLAGGRWDVPELRDLIERVLPREREIRDHQLTHALDEGRPRRFLLNGRRLPDGNMLLAIEDSGGPA